MFELIIGGGCFVYGEELVLLLVGIKWSGMVVQIYYWKVLNSFMLKRQEMNGIIGKILKNILISFIYWIQITVRLVKELVQYMNIIVCGVNYCYFKELY